KGFEKATNKEIAAAAKVRSSGLIYHYFKDKSDLFRQVLQERLPILQLISQGDDLMDLPPREALTLLATTFVETTENRTAVSMMKLMLSESVRHPVAAELFVSIGPGRGLS